MKRYGFLIGLKAEQISEYKRIHAAVWPEVLQQIRQCNIQNYSIFLREPENLLFGYYEYHGDNHADDMKKMGEDKITQEWWALCKPMQLPLDTRDEEDWWVELEPVFLMEK